MPTNTGDRSSGLDARHGIERTVQEAVQARLDAAPRENADGPREPPSYRCTLGIHDERFSPLDVLVNAVAFPLWKISAGAKLRLVASDLEGNDEPPHKDGGRPSLVGEFETDSITVDPGLTPAQAIRHREALAVLPMYSPLPISRPTCWPSTLASRSVGSPPW